MTRYIKLEGIIEFNDEIISEEDLTDNIFELLDENNCYFGGYYQEVDEYGEIL